MFVFLVHELFVVVLFVGFFACNTITLCCWFVSRVLSHWVALKGTQDTNSSLSPLVGTNKVSSHIEIATRSADASGQSPINKLGLMSRGALNAWKKNKQRRSDVAGCLEFWVGKETFFCLGQVGLLARRPQTTPLLTSAAGCLEFGAGNKTSSSSGS